MQEGDGGGDGGGGGGALQTGAQAGWRGGSEEEECCGVAVQVGGTTLPTSLARICHNSGRRLAGEAAAVAHAATHGQGEEVVPHPNTCYLVACHLPPCH